MSVIMMKQPIDNYYRYHSDEERVLSVQRNIPELFSGVYKTVLYIGARTDRFDFSEQFTGSGYTIDVLEVWDENVTYLKTLKQINDIIHCDVRNCEHSVRKRYDVVFWWHGPEHIHKNELKDTLVKLENIAQKLVILGCPFGYRPQVALGGNPYEVHKASLYPRDFHQLGYNTETIIGYRNDPVSRVLKMLAPRLGDNRMRIIARAMDRLAPFLGNRIGGVGRGSNILAWKYLTPGKLLKYHHKSNLIESPLEIWDKLVKTDDVCPWAGGILNSQAEKIKSIVLEAKPDIVVELGHGKSTVYLLEAIVENGKGKLYSIDLPEKYASRQTHYTRKKKPYYLYKTEEVGQFLLEKFGDDALRKHWEFIHMEQLEAIELLCNRVDSIDILFDDGDHAIDAMEKTFHFLEQRIRMFYITHELERFKDLNIIKDDWILTCEDKSLGVYTRKDYLEGA